MCIRSNSKIEDSSTIKTILADNTWLEGSSFHYV